MTTKNPANKVLLLRIVICNFIYKTYELGNLDNKYPSSDVFEIGEECFE